MFKTQFKSKKLFTKISKFNILPKLNKIFATLALVLVMFSAGPAQALDMTDSELNSAISQTNEKLNKLKNQQSTLENQLEIFDTQVELAQQQVNETAYKLTLTEQKIKEINIKINEQEVLLNKKEHDMSLYLKNIYMDGQVSYLELIATSDSFSGFLSKAEYLNAVTENIQKTMDEITAIKADLDSKALELETEKANIEQLKSAQELQLSSIANQKLAKDIMLQQTKGESSSLNDYLDTLYIERNNRSRNNGEVFGDGTDAGYPYTGTVVYNELGWFCSPDTWRMCARQCTSYAAYKATSLGIINANIIRSWAGQADGGNWYWLAARSGLTVSKTPRANSIISFPQQAGMPYGHVAYVNSVNGDGTINLSEYNYLSRDNFGTRSNVDPTRYNGYFIY